MNIIKILVILALSVGAASAQATSEGILAFGDIRGHIEPCGCDPRTDVGGVRRISAAVARYRRQAPKAVVVNLGNVVKPGDLSPAAASIREIISLIKPDASLVNAYEWQALKAKSKIADLPWILSNVSVGSTDHVWDTTRKSGEFEFFGYLGLKDVNLLSPGESLFKQWQKMSKVAASSQRVLLFSGSDRELSRILRTKFFGTIIRSSKVSLGVEMGDQEQNNDRLLVTEIAGDNVWSVPFGGAGLLRLCGLEKFPIPRPVASLFQDKRPNSPFNGTSSYAESQKILSSLATLTFVHWLRLEEESGVPEDVLRVFESLRKADRDSFARMVTSRAKEVDKSQFVGAEACAGCHASSYEIWKKSRHATAITTLVTKNRHEDLTCIECHVLGFKEKGGYVSEGVTPQFSNVQCENCHGPRRLHVQAPTQKTKVSAPMNAKNSCAECHTPPHSPQFDQKKYWKAIEHK